MGEGSYLHNLKRKRKQEECEECKEVIALETGTGSSLSAWPLGEETYILTSLANKNFLPLPPLPPPQKKRKKKAEQKQVIRSLEIAPLLGGGKEFSRLNNPDAPSWRCPNLQKMSRTEPVQLNTHAHPLESMVSPWEWQCVKGTGDENHMSDNS